MAVCLGHPCKLGRPSRLIVVVVVVPVESIEEWIDAIDCLRLLSFWMDFEEEDERLL